jgi:NADPH:quinone reductase-like Zn-dependent oxidoreductase
MKTMKAVVMNRHGGPEVLEYTDIPLPEPGPGEVRVRVRAVALNHLDLWVRKGGPAFHVEFPHRLGSDVAGDVEATGAGVDPSLRGQKTVINGGISCGRCQACLSGDDNFCLSYKILGENTQGGYSQYVVVPVANLAPYPGTLSYPEASSVLLPYLTAWQMLVTRARVRPGEWVLVHGAGSGVGVAAIQMARLYNARVIATASSADKLERAKALGAEHGINYASEDFVPLVKDITRSGVDIVFEHVGGETFEKSIKATRNGGRIVTCGATSGFKPALDLRHIFFRQISILGSTMGKKGELFEVLGHVSRGLIKPVVDRTLPLAKAGEAHEVLEKRQAFGKVVLIPE